MKISSFSKLSLKSIGENEQKLASCLVKQYSWKLVKKAQGFNCLSLDLCGIENRNLFSMFEHLSLLGSKSGTFQGFWDPTCWFFDTYKVSESSTVVEAMN